MNRLEKLTERVQLLREVREVYRRAGYCNDCGEPSDAGFEFWIAAEEALANVEIKSLTRTAKKNYQAA